MRFVVLLNLPADDARRLLMLRMEKHGAPYDITGTKTMANLASFEVLTSDNITDFLRSWEDEAGSPLLFARRESAA